MNLYAAYMGVNGRDPSGLKTAIYEERGKYGQNTPASDKGFIQNALGYIGFERLNWVLDDKEKVKIAELEGIISGIDIALKENYGPTIEGQELLQMRRGASEYIKVIKSWTPKKMAVPEGNSYTFPFYQFENGLGEFDNSEGRQLLKGALQRFAFGANVGIWAAAFDPSGKASSANIAAIRSSYNSHVTHWRQYVNAMKSRGVSPEHIAHRVSKARILAGIRYKKMTPFLLRMKIYYRNRAPKWFPKVRMPGGLQSPKAYDSIYGPSVRWLRSSGKSWDDIIESALRTNKAINKALK